jgi:probable HAF family extracellular repeat protein
MRKYIALSGLIFLVAMCFNLARVQAATPTYTIIDLPTATGANSYANGINDIGGVVGDSWWPRTNPVGWQTSAFFYSQAANDLWYFYNGVSASAINNRWEVVGTRKDTERAYFIDMFGREHELSLGGRNSEGLGINDNGDVVGWAHTGSQTEHAFVYSNGVMQDIGSYFGNRQSHAAAINYFGQVVGGTYGDDGSRSAFLYSYGTVTDLGFPGAARGINELGQIVGWAYTGVSGFLAPQRAVLYSNGAVQDIGTLGLDWSWANDINNSGQIVGASYGTGFASSHAFVYSDGVMRDLNSFLPTGSGWELLEARGINNSGQIVGYGKLDGKYHAFLMTPTVAPEPSTFLLFGGGMAGIAILRKRRRK